MVIGKTKLVIHRGAVNLILSLRLNRFISIVIVHQRKPTQS